MVFRPLLILALTLVTLPVRAHDAAGEMTEAARAFLGALDAGQQAKAVVAFDDTERMTWNFVPKDRRGVSLKEMSPAQREAVLVLLRSGLSGHGVRAVTNIISLESVLRELEGPASAARRDPERYWVTVFGTPDPVKPWGWRFEGHHISVNFTGANGKVSGTPNFLGANPAEVKSGPRAGFRALPEIEDIARSLVVSLTETQRVQAVLNVPTPRELITGNSRRINPLHPEGVAASDLQESQRDQLKQLVSAYVNRMRPEGAEADLAAIAAAGWEKVCFAWAGGTKRGEGHYYRVQGPTFLLEYDNTQNNANHVHSVWREFDGDFGEDLLRRHYDRQTH
jgi:hypothetical protein